MDLDGGQGGWVTLTESPVPPRQQGHQAERARRRLLEGRHVSCQTKDVTQVHLGFGIFPLQESAVNGFLLEEVTPSGFGSQCTPPQQTLWRCAYISMLSAVQSLEARKASSHSTSRDPRHCL